MLLYLPLFGRLYLLPANVRIYLGFKFYIHKYYTTYYVYLQCYVHLSIALSIHNRWILFSLNQEEAEEEGEEK